MFYVCNCLLVTIKLSSRVISLGLEWFIQHHLSLVRWVPTKCFISTAMPTNDIDSLLTTTASEKVYPIIQGLRHHHQWSLCFVTRIIIINFLNEINSIPFDFIPFHHSPFQVLATNFTKNFISAMDSSQLCTYNEKWN